MRVAALKIPLLVIAASCLFLSGCQSGSSSPDLERVALFTIPYGRFDGEIDLFSNVLGQTGGTCPEVCLFMRDGIFYIGNAASKKVLQFTSYGDLLSVYYNPETTPPPDFYVSSSLVQSESAAEVMTQKAIEYPFNMVSAVAVDSNRRLFVADTLPPERVEYSQDDELMLENIVIRFDALGNFIDYLGQEGPGGTPFSALSGIYVNSADELFVVSLRQNGVDVFWYNSAGRLLYRVPVLSDLLPSPYSDGTKNISVLSDVIPAQHGDILYFKIDFYREEVDSETGSHSGIEFDRSVLYPFSITQAAFGDFVNLPVCEIQDSASQGGLPARKPYGMIGVTENNRVFLSTPISRGYEICIVDLNSGRIQRRTFAVSMQEQIYNVFHLSGTGILSALLAGPDEASVVWWRTDTLAADRRES